MNLLPSPISTGLDNMSLESIDLFIQSNFEWSTEGKFTRKKITSEPDTPVLVLIDYIGLIK